MSRRWSGRAACRRRCRSPSRRLPGARSRALPDRRPRPGSEQRDAGCRERDPGDVRPPTRAEDGDDERPDELDGHARAERRARDRGVEGGVHRRDDDAEREGGPKCRPAQAAQAPHEQDQDDGSGADPEPCSDGAGLVDQNRREGAAPLARARREHDEQWRRDRDRSPPPRQMLLPDEEPGPLPTRLRGDHGVRPAERLLRAQPSRRPAHLSGPTGPGSPPGELVAATTRADG